jgi:hypothetical protein
MSSISNKKNFTNEANLLYSLQSYFQIYSLVADSSFKKLTIDNNDLVTDYNYYKTAYFFSLPHSVGRYNSVKAYIIQIRSTAGKMNYQICDAKCSGVYPDYCRARLKFN